MSRTVCHLIWCVSLGTREGAASRRRKPAWPPWPLLCTVEDFLSFEQSQKKGGSTHSYFSGIWRPWIKANISLSTRKVNKREPEKLLLETTSITARKYILLLCTNPRLQQQLIDWGLRASSSFCPNSAIQTMGLVIEMDFLLPSLIFQP